jgi:hypothetical protein
MDTREISREPSIVDSRRSYTTVKRYQVPDRSWEEDKVDYDKIIVKHERRVDPPPPKPRTELDFRITERGSRDYQRRNDEWHISERMTEKEAPGRDIPYRVIEREQVLAPRSSFHYPERDPETVPVLSPLTQERFREYRFERERDYSPPHSLHHHHHHEPEIERYRRESEYHQQPQPQPQPIAIRESAPQAPIIVREERQQPLIIREERRETQQIIVRRDEPNYDFVEKGEVRNEHQSFVRGDPKKGQTQRQWAQAAQAAVATGAVEAFGSRKEPGRWTGERGKRIATAAIGAGGIDKFLDRSPDEKSKLHLAEAVVVGLAANRLANGPRSKSRGQRSTPEKTIGANEAENEVQDEAAEKKNAEDDEFDEGENDVMDEDFNAEKYFDDGDDDYEDGGGGGDDDGDGYGAIGDDFDDGNDHAVGNDDATGDVNAVQALLSRWLDSSASALLLKDDEAVT